MNGKTGYIVSTLMFVLLVIYAVVKTIDASRFEHEVFDLKMSLTAQQEALNKSVIFMKKVVDMPDDVTMYSDQAQIDSNGNLTVRAFYTVDSASYTPYRNFTFRPRKRPEQNRWYDVIGTDDSITTLISPLSGKIRMYVNMDTVK